MVPPVHRLDAKRLLFFSWRSSGGDWRQVPLVHLFTVPSVIFNLLLAHLFRVVPQNRFPASPLPLSRATQGATL